MKVGLLEAVVSAISDSDAEIGGIFTTTSIDDQSAGSDTINLPSAVGLPDTGTIAIGVTKYTYGTLTINGDGSATLSGLSPLLQADLAAGDPIQITPRSMISIVRANTTVNGAVGEYLSTVGRNNGVERDPTIGDDEIFRAIIKALAYNPRGTVYGLEQALDALVGAGNYTIVEDRIDFPGQVFVQISGAAVNALMAVFEGKGYLTQVNDPVMPTNSFTFPIPANTASVQSVKHTKFTPGWTSFQTDAGVGFLPSTLTYADAPNAAAQTWTYAGGTEASQVSLANSVPEITVSTTLDQNYSRVDGRHVPDAITTLRMRVKFTGAANIGANTGRQFYAWISDGAKRFWLSVKGLTNAPNTYRIGLATQTNLDPLTTGVTVAENTWIDVKFVKRGIYQSELYINGTLIHTVAYVAAESYTTTRGVTWGSAPTASSSMHVLISGVELHINDPSDYLIYYINNNQSYTAGTLPRGLITLTSAQLAAGDVGSQLEIFYSPSLNAAGGDWRGVYLIDQVNSAFIGRLTGINRPKCAFVDTGHPNRISVTDRGLTYPQDLGKTIVLSGAFAGNYVIDGLYDDNGVLLTGPLAATATFPPAGMDNIPCSAAHVTVDPGVTAVNVDYMIACPTTSLSGVGIRRSTAGHLVINHTTNVVTTPVTLMPASPLSPVQVTTTNVHSGELLPDNTTVVSRPTPTTLNHYATYLSDPFAYIASYLDGLVAAGIVATLSVQ